MSLSSLYDSRVLPEESGKSFYTKNYKKVVFNNRPFFGDNFFALEVLKNETPTGMVA
jgi:hypothetical protein